MEKDPHSIGVWYLSFEVWNKTTDTIRFKFEVPLVSAKYEDLVGARKLASLKWSEVMQDQRFNFTDFDPESNRLCLNGPRHCRLRYEEPLR